MSMPIIPILLQSKLVQRIRTMVSLDFMLFCFMYRLSQKRKRQLNSERRCHSRYRKSFYKQLSEYERRIRRRYIPRPSLQVPLASAWRRLYDAKQDQALITLTGVDFDTFDWLVARFNRYYDSHSPFVDSEYGLIVPMARHKGRPRHCSGTAILGLCLAWTRTRGSCMVLQMIFGMTANSVSMYLRFGRRILIAVLNKEPDARIQVPDAETIRHYQRLVTNRHPILDGVWCTMDGLKLKLQRAPKVDVENNFFNGWKHDHYVGAVIVFCPDGTIPIVCFNVPGSVHDSLIADWGSVYDKLEDVWERCGGKCTVDSAFSARRNEYLIRSAQTVIEGDTRREFAFNLELNREATSMRQSAEWGMRAFQASFPRLQDRFIFEQNGERRLIVKMCLLLYNLRARRIGINQIRSVYLHSLEHTNVQQLFR